MTRSRKAKIVLALTIAAHPMASANPVQKNANASPPSCAAKIQEAVQALSADTQGTLISELEREQIQKIFEDPQKSPFAAGYVFDLLMEKRLSFLPPQDAEQIKKIIQTAKLKKSKGITGWYEPGSRSITISLPESYHGTIVEFFIKTHEIEHAIQDLTAAGEIGKKSFNYFQRLLNSFDAELRFIEEAGAMQAEWQYLQALPAETKKSIAQELRKDTQLSSGERAVVSRVLLSDAWTAGDHLESEWGAGRYTLPQMEITTKTAKIGYGINLLGVTSSSGAGILGAVYVIESSCQKLLSRSFMLPNGAFYQSICTRFKSIREQQEARFPKLPASLPTKN